MVRRALDRPAFNRTSGGLLLVSVHKDRIPDAVLVCSYFNAGNGRYRCRYYSRKLIT